MATTNSLLDAYFNDPAGQTTFGQPAAQADYTQLIQPGVDTTGASQALNGIYGSASPSDAGGFSLGAFDWSNPSAFGDNPSAEIFDPAKAMAQNAATRESGVWDNIQGFLKQNSGQIFAKAFLGAGQGVLGYLAERRKAREAAAARTQNNQFVADQRNADVARASAVPVVGSMINPNAPRNRGLLGQVKRAV